MVDLPGPGERWQLHPRLSCFGDAVGLLRRTNHAGLLDGLGPVSDREAFARRLIAKSTAPAGRCRGARMSPAQIVVLFAAGALTVWILGGVALRLGGWASMVAGAVE